MEWIHFGDASYELTVLWRLFLASVLGALIGLEREVHGRPAGFRTHLLVTAGACLMMIVSEYFYIKYGDLGPSSILRLDPGRVAAQIITGIGFLGAGAIIKEGLTVRGLTTAACLWIVAGLGMAVGVGLYIPAFFVTAIALFNLIFLKRLERYLKTDSYRTLFVHCADRKGGRQALEGFLEERKLRIIEFGVEKDLVAGEVCYDLVLARWGDNDGGELVEAVADLPGVKKVRFR